MKFTLNWKFKNHFYFYYKKSIQLNIYIFKSTQQTQLPWLSLLIRLSCKQEIAYSNHVGSFFDVSLTKILRVTICMNFSFKNAKNFQKTWKFTLNCKFKNQFFYCKKGYCSTIRIVKKSCCCWRRGLVR